MFVISISGNLKLCVCAFLSYLLVFFSFFFNLLKSQILQINDSSLQVPATAGYSVFLQSERYIVNNHFVNVHTTVRMTCVAFVKLFHILTVWLKYN